jgi:hypothetical protein
MKSEIFNSAITKRNRVRFIYGFKQVEVEPYFLSKNRRGKKVVYGRVNNSNVVEVFEYDKIFNIKVLDSDRFSPIIPILTA